MTCSDCIALASEYVDGYLRPTEVVAVEVHTSTCEACARYIRVLRRSLELAQEIDEIQPSADFSLRLNRRLREIDEAMVDRTRSARSGAALAVAIAGMVAFLAWSPIFSPRNQRDGLSMLSSGPATTDSRFDDTVGGWEWWYGEGAPAAMRPPSANNAFPGPYSPLRVDPPIRGGGVSRTVLTSLIDAE